LSQFQGKQGFGSADYHGEPETSSARRDSLDAFQSGAQDFAARFVGQLSEDVNSVKRVIGFGGEKLSDFLSEMQSRYQG
jgi:ADP-ribosylation factor GTPase-activating protein 2/3